MSRGILITFAEQAVIAITSAETYRALQTRTSDLQESLEYQTATSDVLKAISRSTFDLQPVLETLLNTAARLCDADRGSIGLVEANGVRVAAHYARTGTFDPGTRGRLRPLDRTSIMGRTAIEGRIIHVENVEADPDFIAPANAGAIGRGTMLGVPLLRDGVVLGVIRLAQDDVRPFTQRQIDLVSTFADQAVIALENTRLLTEQREALEQQTATAEVLGVINASPGNLAPVFDAMLEKAMRLCGAAFGSMYTIDGDRHRLAAHRGIPPAYAAFRATNPPTPRPGSRAESVLATFHQTRRPIHTIDLTQDPFYQNDDPSDRALADLGGARTSLMVPMFKDDMLLGNISIYRQEVRPFIDKQIALLQNFAAQAVIAMENARLITETREALEQQTATAEVLGVINANPGNLAPVFEAILEKAHTLCGASIGSLFTNDGEFMRAVATHGQPEDYATHLSKPFRPEKTGSPTRRLVDGERFVHVPDIRLLPSVPGSRLAIATSVTGMRTVLQLPLRKEGTLLGYISAARTEVRPFAEKEIALLENFAAQAVIAMENARLITETREALEQQTATAEVLAVINASPGDLAPVFDAILQKGLRLAEAAFGTLWLHEGAQIRAMATRGMTPALAAFRAQNLLQPLPPTSLRLIETKRTLQYRDVREGEGYRSGVPGSRAVADLGGARAMLGVPLLREGAVIGSIQIYRQEVRAFTNKQIALLENFAAQAVIAMENARLITEIRTARDAAETTLENLRRTQDRLVQTEKMASLGQLTAGIAHEIKNPLNFVNNFSDLSVDLLDELHAAVAPGKIEMPEDTRAEIDEITETLKGNLQKITQHGRRADSIVKNMLLHSRTGASERRIVDLNAIAEEALNLAYHGARAETQGFNITMEKDLDPNVGMVEIYPQEISRVLVNLFSNGFYAAHQRTEANPGFEPMLRLSTRSLGERIEIRVRDNGTGIPAEIRDKIFEPFFTTKPAGQGTGLGLSISFDIVVKQHGGQMRVDSAPGVLTEFTITLPRQVMQQEGGRA